MEAEKLWKAVQTEISGLATMDASFHPNEVYACMNRAQNIVNRDLTVFADKYTDADFTLTDPDDAEDISPISDVESLPELTSTTAECMLPFYCFEAVVVKTVELLNQKTGEYPNAIKNKKLLKERYLEELSKALELKIKFSPRKAASIIDYKDPNRGFRTRF